MGDLDVGMKCIKYMLFITNFMFVLIGFLLISIGTTITCIYNNFDVFMEDHYFSPASLLVAVGIIIFFVSLFGCIGAVRGSTCMVNIYGIFLLLLLILQVSASIAAYAMRANVYDYVEKSMESTLPQYGFHSVYTEAWDDLQASLGCCGVRNASDWYGVYDSGNSTLDFPDSCYNNNYELFGYGCLEALTYIIRESALLIGTGAICVAIVQALGVVFAFMLAKAIRRIKTEEERKKQENRARLYEQLARGTDEKPTPVIYTASSTEA